MTAAAQPQPTIAVVGATGAQGGGLVHALPADPARRFAARALTRQPAALHSPRGAWRVTAGGVGQSAHASQSHS